MNLTDLDEILGQVGNGTTCIDQIPDVFRSKRHHPGGKGVTCEWTLILG